MPLDPFRDAATKADDEFAKAYSKGVNLGPEKWQDAVSSFSAASKHYGESGNPQKAAEAYALATLFYALVHRDAESWRTCSDAMARMATFRSTSASQPAPPP